MIDLNPACIRMIDLVAGVADDQLTDPTPCAEFTVADLIDHVHVVAQGSTRLARKELGERADSDTGDNPTATDLGDDWRKRVGDHVRTLSEAWDDPTAWQGTTSADDLEMSNELWGKIAFAEMVVHGWDLAKATRQPFDLPEETLRACLNHIADFVPNSPVPGLWGTAVEVPADAPLIDQVVAITGRRPT